MKKLSVPNQIIELLQQINTGRITPAHIQALIEMPDEMLEILAKKRRGSGTSTDGPAVLLRDEGCFILAYPDGSVRTVVQKDAPLAHDGPLYDVYSVLPIGWWGKNGYILQRGGQAFLLIPGRLIGPCKQVICSDNVMDRGILQYTTSDGMFVLGEGWEVGPLNVNMRVSSAVRAQGHECVRVKFHTTEAVILNGKLYGPYAPDPDHDPNIGPFDFKENGWSFEVTIRQSSHPYAVIDTFVVRDGVETRG